MKQGVLCNHRVRLLFKKGMSTYRERRKGMRKRKSVRGCIVGPDLATLQLAVAKKGAEDIPGLTDESKPRRLGPKRAGNIRKLFGLGKDDDVRKYVVRRKIEKEGKKANTKAAKIQRLVTPQRIQRKRAEVAGKKARYAKQQDLKAAYQVLLATKAKEKAELRKTMHERRRLSSTRKSESK